MQKYNKNLIFIINIINFKINDKIMFKKKKKLISIKFIKNKNFTKSL